MGSLNRDKQYQGFIDNWEIDELIDEIRELENKIKFNQKLIADVRNNCDHDYVLLATGGYDDWFICEHCGKKIER